MNFRQNNSSKGQNMLNVEEHYRIIAGGGQESLELSEAGGYPVDRMANIVGLAISDIDRLAEDIQKNGLILPIVLSGGKIIDGRRRAIACSIAGVEPRFDEQGALDDKQKYARVLSLNNRRSVNKAQLAIVAALETKENRHKMLGYSLAKDYAREVFNVSEAYYGKAKFVVNYGITYAYQIKQTGFATVGDSRMSMLKTYDFLKANMGNEDDKDNNGEEMTAKCFKALNGCIEGVSVSFDRETIGYVLKTLVAQYESK